MAVGRRIAAVGRRIAAVGRRAVRRTTAAVSPLAVALATFALAAFALAALVNELDIGWWPRSAGARPSRAGARRGCPPLAVLSDELGDNHAVR